MSKNKCSFKGCGHDAIAKTLCTGHYTQQYRGYKLTPLGSNPEKTPVVDGKKICKECNKNKSVSEFYYNNKKYSSDCKPCYIKKVRKRRG